MTDYNATIKAIPMPDRIKRMPISPKGFPVPWFVAWINGVPDFRVVNPDAISIAWMHRRCWVCGEPLGRTFAMTLGPMCAINRTIGEPPSHRDCAVYSAIACPFLSNPRMRRNETNLPVNIRELAGHGIKRNPGAVCVWITRDCQAINVPNGVLFTFGDPVEVLWFAEGRKATRFEVETSIYSGLPILNEMAKSEGPAAVAALRAKTVAAIQYLPAQQTA